MRARDWESSGKATSQAGGGTGQDREARFATDQGGFASFAPNDCLWRKGASVLRLDVDYRLYVLI